MSIHNTKTDIIRKEIDNLIYELRYTEPTADQGIEYLQNKYNYLYSTSESLFKMIVRESLKSDFDLIIFKQKVSIMLDYILKIQRETMTQEAASEKVGVLLGKEYIPKDLYKQDDYKRLYNKQDD